MLVEIYSNTQLHVVTPTNRTIQCSFGSNCISEKRTMQSSLQNCSRCPHCNLQQSGQLMGFLIRWLAGTLTQAIVIHLKISPPGPKRNSKGSSSTCTLVCRGNRLGCSRTRFDLACRHEHMGRMNLHGLPT